MEVGTAVTRVGQDEEGDGEQAAGADVALYGEGKEVARVDQEEEVDGEEQNDDPDDGDGEEQDEMPDGSYDARFANLHGGLAISLATRSSGGNAINLWVPFIQNGFVIERISIMNSMKR